MDESESCMKFTVDIFSSETIGFRRKLRPLWSPPLEKLAVGKYHMSIFVPQMLCPQLRRSAVLQVLSPTGGFLFALFNPLPPEVK